MGKGSQTTSSTTAPNASAMAAYQDILSRANSAASTGYTPYNGETVAPFNAQQNTGIAGINQYANFAQPYIQSAGTMATAAAQPITAAQIQQYMSPYTQSVVDATQAQFNNQNAQQQQGVISNAAQQGALGGNRVGVTQANLANQQQLAQAPVIAGLQNQGYTTGLNTALTEQQALASGAYSLGNLGVAGQSAGLTGAGAQFGAGTSQQQTQQAQDSANYQQWLNQLAFPYQQTQWLAGVDTGVGSQMGGTSSSTAPAPSMLGQIMGGVSSGVGALGATGAFGSAGWLAALALSSGGAVGRASGGVAPDPEQMTIPESHATLVAQQKQLIAGHRRVHMFPHGTPELKVPPGMHRVAASSGVFHYDPKKISPDQIKHLAAHGRENEMLDLGSVSKHDVLGRLHRGELPVAIVERQADGTEVRAAVGTHVTAHHQYAAMQKTKSPGNHVGIEDVRQTLARRVPRAWGGRVPHFDLGGGVANPAFEGPGAGMPYSGGQGFVPTMGITRGHGAPGAPGAPAQDQSVSKMGEQIGAMAKAIGGGGNQKSPMNILPNVPGGQFAPGGPEPIGVAPEAFSPTDISGSAGAVYARGGTVGRYASGGVANLPVDNRIMLPPGYADGGAPYDDGVPFDPSLGGIAPGPDLYNIAPDVDNVAKSILSGSAPLRHSVNFDDQSSPLDTADWPAGPVNAPGLAARNNQSSPLDTAEWPAGPVNAPGPTLNGDGPSPLDAAAWPAGPVGAPEGLAPPPAAPAADSGIAGLSPAPLNLPGTGGFRGPAPAVTGREAIPAAVAVNPETPTLGYADNMDRIAAAHRQIESHGNYGALGPVNPKTGDRAYGAYQVMGANVPVWTKEVLGQSLTPAQFLASKDAQDAVYKAKMGTYIEQLGLPGAVHAWLGPAKKDFTGTSQETYLKKFESALNGTPQGGGDDRRTVAGDDGGLPAHARVAEHTGVAPVDEPSGIDWSEKGKLWPTLMAAGFGMMASKSPFPGVAIGEGGMQGLNTYSALKQQENQQKMSQAKLSLEAQKLTQAGDLAHQKLALATKPYSEMTQYQKASVAATATYRQGLLDRENTQYLGPTQDGTGSVIMDKRSGTIRTVPIQIAPRPVSGATASLATQLIADREKQRAADPSLPPLTLEEATTMAHRAPNADQDTIRRLNLASGAWKAWQNNPSNMGKKDAPENSLDFWERRYGVAAGTPPSGTAKAQPPASPAPAAAKPAAAPAAAPMPPRPPTVPADAKPQRNKSTGALRWVGADGSIYSADGTRQQ